MAMIMVNASCAVFSSLIAAYFWRERCLGLFMLNSAAAILNVAVVVLRLTL